MSYYKTHVTEIDELLNSFIKLCKLLNMDIISAYLIGSYSDMSFISSSDVDIVLVLNQEEKTTKDNVSKFFNDNNSKLICDDDNDIYIRENEHILKRSLALGEYNFLNHAANNSKYELDWNFYEMVDGKKETILDYLDMIIGDEELASEYDIPELKSLVRTLKGRGAKKGNQLN